MNKRGGVCIQISFQETNMCIKSNVILQIIIDSLNIWIVNKEVASSYNRLLWYRWNEQQSKKMPEQCNNM